MPYRQKRVLIAACLAGMGLANLGLVDVAWGQAPPTPPPDNGKISFQSALVPRKPKPGLPDVAAPPQAWPRLDPGAILCRTADDLDRLAARNAGQGAGGPVDCQVIRDVTAITILQRVGPGKEEVQLTSGKVGTTGWTNAWLPEKAPTPTRASVR